MRNSEIKLTKREFDFSTNPEYPRIKHAVIQKVSKRLDSLGVLLREHLATNDTSLHALWAAGYKTTRGENYELMPYVVCDFPRIGSRNFPILFRTMFWWGNYYSLNIFIDTAQINMDHLLHHLPSLAPRKLRIYTGTNIWQQNLDDKDFVFVKHLDEAELRAAVAGMAQIKLSLKLPFKKEEKLEGKALKLFGDVLGVLQTLKPQVSP